MAVNYENPSGRIAIQIRALMSDRGESLDSLAAGSGISLSTLKRRMAGVTPFTIDELSAVAAHLGVPLVQLIRHIQRCTAKGSN